jgi:phosphohistidine swiveling domain-containing protein
MAWTLITFKQYPIFSRRWIGQAFCSDMKKAVGVGLTKYKSLYSGTYADSQEFNEVKNFLTKKINNNPRYIKQLCDNWRAACEDLIKSSEKLANEDFSSYSDKQLFKGLENIVKKLRLSVAYVYLHHGLDKFFETWINELLDAKNVSSQKKIDYFHILSSPKEATGLIKSKQQLERIIRQRDKSKKELLIGDYASEYGWLGYDTGVGYTLTIREVKQQLIDAAKSAQPVYNESRNANRSKLIKELHLDKKSAMILDLLSTITFLGSYRLEANMKAGVYLTPLLNELARRFNATYEDITQFTLDELKQAIIFKRLNRNEINRRKKKYGLLTTGTKYKVYTGKAVDRIEEKEKIPPGLLELKGMVTNPGQVIGRVKLILNKKDYAGFKSGNILVTKMTSPNLISVLQKCSAIVTDIGGITSHAAIISRELDKPCIIGTKIATRVLKDGNLIEVDANRGVVKILKK